MDLRQTLQAWWKPLFWIAFAGVLVLSTLPDDTPIPTTGWDKSNHMLAFGVLALLILRAYPGRVWLRLGALLVFGVLIEILQAYTPNRTTDWHDVVADAVGIAIGWVLSRLAVAWLRI